MKLKIPCKTKHSHKARTVVLTAQVIVYCCTDDCCGINIYALLSNGHISTQQIRLKAIYFINKTVENITSHSDDPDEN